MMPEPIKHLYLYLHSRPSIFKWERQNFSLYLKRIIWWTHLNGRQGEGALCWLQRMKHGLHGLVCWLLPAISSLLGMTAVWLLAELGSGVSGLQRAYFSFTLEWFTLGARRYFTTPCFCYSWLFVFWSSWFWDLPVGFYELGGTERKHLTISGFITPHSCSLHTVQLCMASHS